MLKKSDTHPAMEAAAIKGYRQMSSAQRLKMAFSVRDHSNPGPELEF